MECKKCKKAVLASELVNGYCSECINKYSQSELNQNINSISKYFKIWCICIILVGIILGVLSFLNNLGIYTMLIVISVSFIAAALLRGFAEIIQLLEDIKNK